MELWIRSQDKTTLIKSDEIYICEHENKYLITATGTSHILGSYSNYKRALEVLGKIQQRLINLATLEIAPSSYKVLPKDTSNVYEMPQE